MGFIMLKSSQAQITQLKINLIVISASYKSYVKSSEICWVFLDYPESWLIEYKDLFLEKYLMKTKCEQK